MTAIRSAIQPAIRAAISGVYGSSSAWSPLTLFAASEVGVWYDPSDFSTLFKDPAVATPVTAVGDPAGLILDKSDGLVLGPEIFTGSVASATGWTLGAGWSISGGVLTGASAVGAIAYYTVPSQPAGWYKMTFTLATVTAADCVFRLYAAGGANLTLIPTYKAAAGQYTAIAHASDVWARIGIGGGGGAGFSGTISQVSVQALSGNHAYQATAGLRPALAAGSTINYDGVDDYLRTVMPNLGTDATVCRATTGVGTTILTGQTIGAGNYDDSTDHCGLIIVNRALTAAETASVTAWLNAKAGV